MPSRVHSTLLFRYLHKTARFIRAMPAVWARAEKPPKMQKAQSRTNREEGEGVLAQIREMPPVISRDAQSRSPAGAEERGSRAEERTEKRVR